MNKATAEGEETFGFTADPDGAKALGIDKAALEQLGANAVAEIAARPRRV